MNLRDLAVASLALLVLAGAGVARAAPDDGTIVSRQAAPRLTAEQAGLIRSKNPLFAKALETLNIQAITYKSDGLRVTGMIARPEGPGPFPAIIINRGGDREFGALDPLTFASFALGFVQAGYVVVGSNYRGAGGGEGHEEFGGADVDDVMALIPLLRAEPGVDAGRIGIYGASRGGMMTYLALARTTLFKAAVVESGLSDSFQTVKDLPDMETGVYRELIPGYDSHRDEALRARSPVLWADRLSRTTPILVLHGTGDWRVAPRDALAMSQALLAARVPFRLVMFEGGGHGSSEFRVEEDRMEIEWFNRYLRDRVPLPNLTPHGP